MKAIGVIPSRFGSTRFPGKPLTLISGKPMICWVIEGARSSKKLQKIIVATDHNEIAAAAKKAGADVVMTPSELPTGSDRVWQAARDLDAEVVLNIQGDEPLIQGEVLDSLVLAMENDKETDMATLGRAFQNQEEISSLNTAKIVLNHRSEAIYFSRFSVPFSRQPTSIMQSEILKHVGIYAYRKPFLKRYCEFGEVALERAEGLEQLRALYMGAKIKVIKTDFESWGVDTPDDVVKIEKKLRR